MMSNQEVFYGHHNHSSNYNYSNQIQQPQHVINTHQFADIGVGHGRGPGHTGHGHVHHQPVHQPVSQSTTNNQQQTHHHNGHQRNQIHHSNQDYEREREIEKQIKRERLSKLKCSRGESWVWNPRQFYCQIMCPVCERGSRELTVLHFRNHLELQHTAEEVENVKVCKLCHRQAVQNRLDIFDGLILDLDSKSKQAHIERKHPNLSMDHPSIEFMPIYEKHKRTMGDNWGLEGVERDTQKIYKYAKENFSRAKKNESRNSVTPNLDTPDPSESGVTSSSTDYQEIRSDGQKRGPESFPEPITPPDSETAISPHKTIHLTQNQPSSQGYNGMNQSVMLQSHANGPIMTTSNEMVNYEWSAPGFSFRSLLGEMDEASWFNNNVKDQKTNDISKRSGSHLAETDSNRPIKSRKIERRADPELKKLRCGIGGSYRFSMSKLNFSRVCCPYCVVPSDSSEEAKTTNSRVYIKAEYWRRHVTEVHNKPDEIAETKKLTLCLQCYNNTLNSSKERTSKDHNSNLPDFDALFHNKEAQEEHIAACHASAPEGSIEFISVWDKKDGSQQNGSHEASVNSHTNQNELINNGGGAIEQSPSHGYMHYYQNPTIYPPTVYQSGHHSVYHYRPNDSYYQYHNTHLSNSHASGHDGGLQPTISLSIPSAIPSTVRSISDNLQSTLQPGLAHNPNNYSGNDYNHYQAYSTFVPTPNPPTTTNVLSTYPSISKSPTEHESPTSGVVGAEGERYNNIIFANEF